MGRRANVSVVACTVRRMTTVFTALIAGLLAVVAAVAPTLALTRRKRLLKRIIEEAAAVKAIEDPKAKAEMEKALNNSAWEYADMTFPAPSASSASPFTVRVVRRMAVALITTAVAIAVLVATRDIENDIVRRSLIVVAVAVGLGSSLVVTTLQMRDYRDTLTAAFRERRADRHGLAKP
jgi:hypothetical protein